MASTPDLAVHIRELEIMHKVSVGEINAIIRPTVLFYHTNELKTTKLAVNGTDLTKNVQDNSATLPVDTQPSSPHSPVEDTSFIYYYIYCK